MSAQANHPSAKRLIVVGQGAAGLCAAVSALAQARAHGLTLKVTLLDAAPMDASGGNTRWSPSNIRLQANHQMAPGFVDEVMAESGGLADFDYFQQLAEQARRYSRGDFSQPFVLRGEALELRELGVALTLLGESLGKKNQPDTAASEETP